MKTMPSSAAKSGSPACGRECGQLIVNADDWGRDALTTDRTLACVQRGTVSSVSAMVWMADSERAAALALQHGVDAGLHLNLTLSFTGGEAPAGVLERQRRIAAFLLSHRFAYVVYHPALAGAFDYLVKAQREEYARLYGAEAARIDGHHHMHLCANVLGQRLMPEGILVRRNLSFAPGEKSFLNRSFRAWQDRRLARRYRTTDSFFDLQPLEPQERLRRIARLEGHAFVEIETHPVNEDEYRFLSEECAPGRLFERPIARGYALPAGAPRPCVEQKL